MMTSFDFDSMLSLSHRNGKTRIKIHGLAKKQQGGQIRRHQKSLTSSLVS